jgi:hypothetical protein
MVGATAEAWAVAQGPSAIAASSPFAFVLGALSQVLGIALLGSVLGSLLWFYRSRPRG